MQRVIYGEVAARRVYAPRQLGCTIYTKHLATLHSLTNLLVMRSYGPQLTVVQDYFQCEVVPLEPGKLKKAIIQVRPCPQFVYSRPQGRGNFWRCLNDTEANYLYEAVSRTLSDHWTVRISSQFTVTNGEDALRAFSCDIQEYSAADMIIGVHGAGLTHMMFLRPGSIVIELIGQWDGRMTPLCGFHGPLASVYDVHHFIHYFDAHNGQTVDFDDVAKDIQEFTAKVEEANTAKSFKNFTTQYYDKTQNLYNF